ncbi:DUF58 domain-containing protein [Flavobacteriales bacterium]|jgi:uncharacterized protein (DUF58 family)|nr:DUF58 domain-containing protein [Flavobacteriales bacterium]
MATIDYSQVKKFESLELLAKQVVEGFITGLHKSPFHGFSVEFAEHRLYNPGESTRHIDWKLYGRTNKLFVKRYEEETNLRCQLVIDRSSSMYYPESAEQFSKISFSAYCAAALIQLLKRQRDAVGLSIFGEALDVHTPSKSSVVHHKMLYDHLEKLLESDEQSQTFAVDALHQIAESVHKRSLVMVFSDMLDNSPKKNEELFSALQHLKHNKHEVILFHVVDKKTELDFEFENRPYTFIDKETGEQVKAHPSSIKESYVTQMKAYEQELKLKCSQYRIDFVEADINQGFDQVLLGYLIKRGKLN